MTPVLSIRQPWAWLVVNGHKPVENRDWPTNFRGPLAVHAGKTMSRRYYNETVASLQAAGICPPDLPAYEQLERGGIVGTVRVVDCVREIDSPWKQEGSFGFVLTDARPLPFISCVGRLGFFNVPENVVQLGEGDLVHRAGKRRVSKTSFAHPMQPSWVVDDEDVRAILDGRKTQHRLLIWPPPTSLQFDKEPARWAYDTGDGGPWRWSDIDSFTSGLPHFAPYRPGAFLWMREAYAKVIGQTAGWIETDYRATYVHGDRLGDHLGIYRDWMSGADMPREGSRLALEVVGVRAQQVQSISQEDALAEGAPPSHPSIDRVSREFGYPDFSRSWFAQRWEEIHGAGTWDANLWVWAIEFKKSALKVCE